MIFLLLNHVLSTQWYNPLSAGVPVIQNQGWTHEIGQQYQRLPDRAKGVVRDPVFALSKNTAGLAIHFNTDAKDITVRYVVTGGLDLDEMPALGVSGLDLWCKLESGEYVSALSKFAFEGKQVTYTFKGINPGYKEFHLYLPTYNGISDLLIGTNDGANFDWIEKNEEKPIVVYGTSIAQGRSASRPSMAWATILQRRLQKPLINLGFSGNGKMEKEVLDFVVENDASLYILDCNPNLVSESLDQLISLYVNGVEQIRKLRDAPILMVEMAGYADEFMNTQRNEILTRTSKGLKEAYDSLVKKGVKDLYYLSKADINLDMDSYTDYVHPNNYGMVQYADAYEKKVREILKLN